MQWYDKKPCAFSKNGQSMAVYDIGNERVLSKQTTDRMNFICIGIFN